MGLDMYLSATLYTSKYSENKLNKKLWKMFKELKKTNIDSIELKIEAGYWRKANHIHKWFVDHVQEGEDNCNSYFVSREQLKELMELCKKVLVNKLKASTLLPTQEGFFFGETEIDEWYFETIKDTITIIEYCLSLPEKWDFEYCSSW